MNAIRSALGRCAGVALMSLLAACGGGGDGGSEGSDTTPPPADGNPPSNPSPQGEHPSGVYWSWTQERVPFTDPQGFIYYYDLFKYTYAKFFDNGLVYVGPPTPDYAAVQCTAPSQDASGNDLCAAYSISNGQITIGVAAPVPISKTSLGWTIGDKPYTPMAPQGDVRLDGSYTSYACYLAMCSQATFEFKPDGTFTASRLNTYANTLGHLFVGGSGSADQTGAYRVEGYGITLDVDGGNSGKVFFFIDGSTLQIAEDWYMKD